MSSRWATKEEMLSRLEPVNLKTGVKESGVPIMYDDKYLYIDQHNMHNLIIGSTGSGKTQSVILPIIRLSLMANDSVVVNDPKGDLYRRCANAFNNKDYNVLLLDFDDTKYGNNWNPLTLPYELYKNDNKDKAVMLVEDLAYYLFFENNDNNADPFWTNSVINFFTGIVLYLFENAKEEEINIMSVYEIGSFLTIDDNSKEFIDKLDPRGNIYSNLVGTLKAPTETKGSIISVFNQKIKKYISRENLSNMLSHNDINLRDICEKPTALFIVSGKSSYANNLVPLLISQIIEAGDFNGNRKRVNMLLDEFDSMVPIKDFYKTIEYCRSLNINISITIKSYIHLYNMYSKEDTEILLMCFGNIIYLLSDDIYTLEDISKRCGYVEVDGVNKPLITIEDLKTIKIFEAIILAPRMMPYKTKLLPDFQIDWGYEDKDADLPLRKKYETNYFEE